jgi:hypothetical protein
MAVTVAELATYLNASPVEPTLPAILADAEVMVSEHLGAHGRAACPVRIREWAVKELAGELFARRNSGPGGVVQWGGVDGQPIRLARDPLNSVRAMLGPYRGLGAVG